MVEKQQFSDTRAWEFEVTKKVMRSYPEGKLDIKPHEVARSAKELMQTLIQEEYLTQGIIKGKMDMSKMDEAKKPQTVPEIVAAYEAVHAETDELLAGLPEEDFDKEIHFFKRPIRRGEALWIMLHDTIHHRGQLSVYIRLAGGKVPSIYGPSYDEPIN